MSRVDERRCPNCGALVSAEAEWCGQCYASLAARSLEDPPAPARGAALSAAQRKGVVPVQAREGEPAWPCSVCGNRNPIDLEACAACGTPFAHLLREPERRVDVAPGSALAWSLVFPGLGHLRCGRSFDGVARVILFLWTAGTVVVLLLSRSGKAGLGPTGPLLILFLAAALALYATSALDAFRVASGDHPLVSSRMLLWGSAGLVLLSVVMATIISVGAVRSR
ncbi:MAG: hypothetical protein HYU54_06140 [Actinobacteria bacterium]|nr:hypothetical protein [Actinomycetota bacterium]